jgi:hypothetical protein
VKGRRTKLAVSIFPGGRPMPRMISQTHSYNKSRKEIAKYNFGAFGTQLTNS